MTTPLFVALARCATARAHLAGAESLELEDQAHEAFADTLEPGAGFAERRHLVDACRRWDAARRRYWRELHTAAVLSGAPSRPAAAQLGEQA